jgi:hypothetical protein
MAPTARGLKRCVGQFEAPHFSGSSLEEEDAGY